MAEEDGNDLYDKAVKVVLRDKKCSTSYIQRRLCKRCRWPWPVQLEIASGSFTSQSPLTRAFCA